jgi:hypothetical protein
VVEPRLGALNALRAALGRQGSANCGLTVGIWPIVLPQINGNFFQRLNDVTLNCDLTTYYYNVHEKANCGSTHHTKHNV